MKENKLNYIGMIILIILFCLFYFISNYFLSKRNINKVLPKETESNKIDTLTYEEDINILNSLYTDARILYDVVNNKFTVSQEDVIIIGDITYKKITNFDTIMNNIFTENGIKKYIDTLKNYFAYNEDSYYLAGNLISYQTYIFRGDNTNIYVTNTSDNMIEGIIYEKWSSNEKATLATVKAVKESNKWLIDEINILYSDGGKN